MLNLGIIGNVIGILLSMLGLFMWMASVGGWITDGQSMLSLFYSGLITIGCGASMWWPTRRRDRTIQRREGFLIVALGWIFISLFSALPYWMAGVFDVWVDSLFESVSGLTTTGATVMTDIESMPNAILLWRSLTQWIGGMGIIVLTVAILPLLGIGGVELFVAEAPGPTSEKLHPRITETAKRLWLIYVTLTVGLVFLLFIEGMTLFEAVNHGLTTMATGGFSTKNASIAAFNSPIIEYTITLFMLLAGVNYSIIYYGLKGRFKKVWSSDEFKTYLYILAALIMVVTLGVYGSSEAIELEEAFRQSAFQVISVITTTGFITADYTSWSTGLTMLFFLMLFLGACAGSTSGGIKIIRHLAFFKNAILELKRLLHPRAIIRMKIDHQVVAPRVITHIMVFLLFYIMLFIIGALVMSWIMQDMDQPLLTAIGSVATSLSNVGPGIGSVGPVDNFAAIPDGGKGFLMLLMLMGRLELFTLLIVFSPYFWRHH